MREYRVECAACDSVRYRQTPSEPDACQTCGHAVETAHVPRAGGVL